MSIIRRPQKSGNLSGNYPNKLKQIFLNRGIENESDLDTHLSKMLPISSLKNTDKAAELLFDVITKNQKILIVADFDADGATACALLVRFLRSIGAKVDYKVPNRKIHGYGLSKEIVSEIIPIKPALIITVDNGISSHQGVSLAKQNGIRVLVTDHHLSAKTLPDADVIVNPNLSDDDFKSKSLSGVGVAFYVACALHNLLKNNNFYQKITKPKLTDYLDLVALGTIADVVPMDKNNRILVFNGLKKIRMGLSYAGINALFQLNKKSSKHAVTSDIAFSIAPKINAAGRMEDMSFGIECLLDDKPETATQKAFELCQMNTNRQSVEQTMQQQAQKILERLSDDNLPFGLCLYQPDWHEGVVGIVAGRLKEKHHRPTIIFAHSNDGFLKGSARSIAGFNIRDSLDRIQHKTGLIDKFGGHTMAAGLTIKKTDFMQFKIAFDNDIRTQLNEADFNHSILSDGGLSDLEFNLDFAKLLRDSMPWGQNFPEPIFDDEFFVVDYRIVGEKHLKMTVRPKDGADEIDAIAFNTPPDVLPIRQQSVKMAYQLDVNRWQNRESLQIKIVEIVK